MSFNDPFYKGKSHARTLRLCIQFIEKAENEFVMVGGNAHAIVLDEKHQTVILPSSESDLDV